MGTMDKLEMRALDLTTIDNSKYYVYINGVYIEHVDMSALFLPGNLNTPQSVNITIPYLKEIEVLNNYHNLRGTIFHETSDNEIFLFADGYVSSVIDYNYEASLATIRLTPSYFLLSQGELGSVPPELSLCFLNISNKLNTLDAYVKDGIMGMLAFHPNPDLIEQRFTGSLSDAELNVFKPGEVFRSVIEKIMGKPYTEEGLKKYFTTIPGGSVGKQFYLGSPVQIIANLLYLAVRCFSTNVGSFLDIIFVDSILNRISNLNISDQPGSYSDAILRFIEDTSRIAGDTEKIQPFNSWTSFDALLFDYLKDSVAAGTTSSFSLARYIGIWQNLTGGKGSVQAFPSHYKRDGEDIINQISFYDNEYINRSKILLSNIFYPKEVSLPGVTQVSGAVPTRYTINVLEGTMADTTTQGLASQALQSVSLIVEENISEESDDTVPDKTHLRIKLITLKDQGTSGDNFSMSDYEKATGKVISKKIPIPAKLSSFANAYRGEDAADLDITEILSEIPGVEVDSSVRGFINKGIAYYDADDAGDFFTYVSGEDEKVVGGQTTDVDNKEQRAKSDGEEKAEVLAKGWQLYYLLILIHAIDYAVRDYLKVTGRTPSLNEGVVDLNSASKYPRFSHPVLCIYNVGVSVSREDITEDNLADYDKGYLPIKGSIGNITRAQYADSPNGSSCSFRASTIDLWNYLVYFSMHNNFKYAISKAGLGVALYKYIYEDKAESMGLAEFYRPGEAEDEKIFDTFDIFAHLKAKPDRTVWISNEGLQMLNDHFTDLKVPINYVTPEVYWKTFYSKNTKSSKEATGEDSKGVGGAVISMGVEGEDEVLYSHYSFSGEEWTGGRSPIPKYLSKKSDPRELNKMLLQYQQTLSYNKVVITEDEVVSRHTF